MRNVVAAAVLFALFAGPAQAAPMAVSAGESVTFNFDLSGDTPPPPYLLASLFVNTDGLDFEPCDTGPCALLDIGTWDLWTELNGGGSSFFHRDLSLGSTFQPEMRDGVFSAVLHVIEGLVFVDPVACGISADGARTPDCPAGPLPPAPEPATLSLLAIAAAGVYVRSRRR